MNKPDKVSEHRKNGYTRCNPLFSQRAFCSGSFSISFREKITPAMLDGYAPCIQPSGIRVYAKEVLVGVRYMQRTVLVSADEGWGVLLFHNFSFFFFVWRMWRMVTLVGAKKNETKPLQASDVHHHPPTPQLVGRCCALFPRTMTELCLLRYTKCR